MYIVIPSTSTKVSKNSWWKRRSTKKNIIKHDQLEEINSDDEDIVDEVSTGYMQINCSYTTTLILQWTETGLLYMEMDASDSYIAMINEVYI